jgi:hypothetical protein
MTGTETWKDTVRTAWRNPVLRFEGRVEAPPEAVYDLLIDLRTHLEWGGERQSETTRLLTLEAPEGPAAVGTEFFTTGSDGKAARWSDRSVVTEATRPHTFEFVTDGRREGKHGSAPWLLTAIHRYEIVPEAGGSLVTYTQDLTRLEGAPWILSARGLNRIVFRVSARYMRRGFDGLLSMSADREAQAPGA